MSKYDIVAAIDQHFGYLTFHFDGSTNTPNLTNANGLAYAIYSQSIGQKI